MALDMYLEMNCREGEWEIIKQILLEMDMDRCMKHRLNSVWGNIGNGEIFITATSDSPRRTDEIIAEGRHGCQFSVNSEIELRINNAMYDKAVDSIRKFLTLLTERTEVLFVLSFQYEGVYAIRDRQRGFEWFWDNPR